jgi:hypothetical protein
LAASAAWITANAWLALGDYDAAREWLSYALEAGKPRLWIDQVEIRIRLAEGRDGDAHELLDRWVARIPPEGGCCLHHRMLGTDPDPWSFAAFVEGVLGHDDHAAAFHEKARLAAVNVPPPTPAPPWGSDPWPLIRTDLLLWGYMPTADQALLARDSADAERAEEELQRSLAFLEALAEDRQREPGATYAAARIHAVLGEQRRAMALLYNAVENGWARSWMLRRDPCLDSLRSRGDFMTLTGRLDRIIAEQRQRIEAAGVESHARLRP